MMKITFFLLLSVLSVCQAKDINPLCESEIPENLKKSFSNLINKYAIHTAELGFSLRDPKSFYKNSDGFDSALNFSRTSTCASNTKDVTEAYLLKIQTTCYDQCRQNSCLDTGKNRDCKTFSTNESSTFLMCIGTCDSVVEQYKIYANVKSNNIQPNPCTKESSINRTSKSLKKIVEKLENDAGKSANSISK